MHTSQDGELLPAGLTNGRVLSGVRVQLLPIMAAPRKLGRRLGSGSCSGAASGVGAVQCAPWTHAPHLCLNEERAQGPDTDGSFTS